MERRSLLKSLITAPLVALLPKKFQDTDPTITENAVYVIRWGEEDIVLSKDITSEKMAKLLSEPNPIFKDMSMVP